MQKKTCILRAFVVYFVHENNVIGLREQNTKKEKMIFMLLSTAHLQIIADALGVTTDQIENITLQKKGMSNYSFELTCKGQRYIFRIPGEGTDKFIKREQEQQVYQVIADKGFCDNPVYINAENGCKLAIFLDDVHVCNDDDIGELTQCMSLLRKLHNMKLQVDHTFDLYREINSYEALWGERASYYDDYEITKKHVLDLKPVIDKYAKPMVLAHIDANCDNYLFYKKGDGTKGLQLTDWEYAGMQDPDVDLAMFCIYSMYDRGRVDRLIDIYYEGECDENTRTKIYCYIATCGLLWSNWCEYKKQLGVEFGEYAIRQYQYAKEYYDIVQERLLNVNNMKGGE